MKNHNREGVTGILKLFCLGIVLFVGSGSQTGGFLPESHAASVDNQVVNAKVVKNKRIRLNEERELRRQNRLYKKQAAQMERQYRRRARLAESTAERDTILAIAEYWKAESARAR